MPELPKEVSNLLGKLYDNNIETVTKSKRLVYGNIYLFGYLPKMKSELPYWDALPMIMLLDRGGGSILGINLHYIPWINRMQFVKRVMAVGRRIRYEDIKKAWNSAKIPGAFAYLSIRRYLLPHIKTNIKVFGKDNWEPAVKNIMPKFKKAKDQAIYAEMRKQLRAQKSSK